MNLNRWLLSRSNATITLLVGVGCLLLGVLDFITPYEVALTAPFAVLVSVAVWYGSPLHGYAVAFFGTFTRVLSAQDLLVKSPYLYVWNFILEGSVLIGLAVIATKFKISTQKELAQARIDPLTGVLSRRGFLEMTSRELERAVRYGTPTALLLIDIDKFKKVNDTFGHMVGDKVLREVAEELARGLRAIDVVGRWGGDEFVVLLPDTTVHTSEAIVGRLRRGLRRLGDQWHIGFSIGIAACTDAGIDAALHHADMEMYHAKRNGRGV